MNANNENPKDSCENSEQSQGSQVCCGGACKELVGCCDWQAIANRVKQVILDPKNIWKTIQAENRSPKEIYLSYLIPLATIGALCGVLGTMIFGVGGLGFKPGFFTSLIQAAVHLVITLALLMVNAYIYKMIAPYFNGSTNENSTFRLVAYGSTAALLGGYLMIFPPLAIASIFFSIYSLYTVYQGIPEMTGVTEKRLPYFATCLITSIVAGIIIGIVVTGALGIGAGGLAIFNSVN